MSPQHLTLYIFGDQTFDVDSHIKEILHQRQNPVIEDFLTRAYDAVRVEIFNLPPQARVDLPRFTCLDDLMVWDRQNVPCIPLEMAVTCIYHICKFITQSQVWDCTPDKSRVLGLCTGSLAAAALSCSQSFTDLVIMGVDAVTVAFRIGLHVGNVAKRVSPWQDPSASWSIVVPGAKSAEAVDNFNSNTNLPLTSRPYISVYASNGATVTASSKIMSQLINSEHFKGLRYKSLPIYAPYHAPHLNSELDVTEIMKGLRSSKAADHSKQVPIIAGAAANEKVQSFTAVLTSAVRHVLLEPIRWDNILKDLRSDIERASAKSFSITAIGTSADQLIYTALNQTALKPLLPADALLQRRAASQPSPSDEDASSYASPKMPKLAIIGISGRFPGAKDNESFWEVLHQGLDVHKPVPALHWDSKTHVDPTGSKKNTSAAPFGCWLDEPDVFDARFFNISPREAPQIDPAQRLALMTAYEAIEQAGIVPDATPSTRRDRVGVFYGVTSNDWMETNSAQDIDTYFIPGGNRAFIPGRINYFFKFSGPSYAVDTACSSSLAGIHLACNSLWRGDIDTAIAGGTNVLTNPDFTAGLDRGHFLSRTGNCKTFDDGADGYCRGEGIGTVIIKRLDDAIADRDPILATILGAYTNHSAESESITRPHVGAQRAIFTKILNQGAVDPYSVSYVEMHGTGTQAGDAGEMSSVLDTFAPPLDKVSKARTDKQALYLGSAKANIGHGEAASGISSLIKVLLMMQKNTIVPHCGIKTKINRKFPTDLAARNVNIALQPIPWHRSDDPSKPRRVFVNNFSAAGGNSALLLEDAPILAPNSDAAPDPRSTQLIALSAKNGISLQGNIKSMISFLKQNPEASLGPLSYTTTARRVHHKHRVMVAGTSSENVIKQLEAALAENLGMTRPKSSPNVVFTFTGQGAQYPGMGKRLFTAFSFFNTELRRLDHTAQTLGFPSILPVIESDGQDITIFSPTTVQLANVCVQMALVKLWASWGVQPTAVSGHSLGQYAALNTAGVLSDTDTIYLVGSRARLLEEKCTRDTHAMLVIKGSVSEVSAALAGHEFEVACINSPVETVLAGPNEHISALMVVLTNKKMKSTLLKIPYAFHSSQVEPIIGDFLKVAAGVTFYPPSIPVICPLDGTVVETGTRFDAQYLADHTRKPVEMLKALQEAHKKNLIVDQTQVLEIGPHPAIGGMVKAVLGSHISCLASLQRGRCTWQVLGMTLKALYTAGADIRWSELHRDFTSSHTVLPLPAYSWDLKKYWMQYVNDWSLRKGDPPLVMNAPPKLESTTIHRVVQEDMNSDKGSIIVEANIAREDLSPLVQGHEVDGIPLCTPSVYADIALTLGTYLVNTYRPNASAKLVDVSEMTISKALILREGATEQLIQAHSDVDWKTQSAATRFMSFDNKGKLQEHSRCVLHFRDGSLQQKLQDQENEIKLKMQALRDGVASFTTARFNRPMVYRAIRPLARFHDDYRAIDEVILNSNTLEASSKLSFGTVRRDGSYHTHPAIIDSLTQSCGFTMNCNDSTDLDNQVFMNHGWGSFQIFEPLDFEKTYTTYTQMTEGDDKLWHGDVVVFDGDKVVAFFGQIAIQGVPRRILKVILSIESGAKSQKKQARAAAPTPTEALPAKVAQLPVSNNSQISTFDSALLIIAEESGLAKEELIDNTVFGDVGIDSLLGLTISSRFKEELDLDMDFNALFYEYPTVSDLRQLFGASVEATSSSPSDSGRSGSASPAVSAVTGATTPPLEDISGKVDFRRALEIISEESGVSMDELTDDTSFADAGVDSLLTLVIVSRFRDELDLDIMHESLLLECPTVEDLRIFLVGDQSSNVASIPVVPELSPLTPAVLEPVAKAASSRSLLASSVPNKVDNASLAARKKEVDGYMEKYLTGFAMPTFDDAAAAPGSNERVVLVTGASGSLGSHIVYHLAQLPDVKTVICLNRENRAEPFARQIKAMREKGIRFPEHLKPKLVVFQTDAAKPRFGLSEAEYSRLVGSTTHLIHNAWPMSAKRPLSGFESQFQVMRNLIDFGSAAASRRPQSFRFSFQMVSSIGVVGNYGLDSPDSRVMVPEAQFGIDCVLPNGYSDAKWGCERMVDQTLHKASDRFRTMVVRLGQIAGSKTSGYWNPMEHFGFLIKSSQTLHALPDAPGTVFWTPVNDIAATLSDLVLGGQEPHAVYHIENPVGQSWSEMNVILADALKIDNLIPFEDWVERVRIAPQRDNPAATLLEFLDSNYLRMSCGGLVLDVKNTLEHSATLRSVGPVSEEVARKYIHIWKEIGFLN